jgi:hypothetical protein
MLRAIASRYYIVFLHKEEKNARVLLFFLCRMSPDLQIKTNMSIEKPFQSFKQTPHISHLE